MSNNAVYGKTTSTSTSDIPSVFDATKGTPSVDITEDAVRAAIRKEPGAVQALYLDYRPILRSIAKKSPNIDLDEAYTMASAEFVAALDKLDPDTPNVVAKLYTIVNTETHDEALRDRTVSVPADSIIRYRQVMRRFGSDEDGNALSTSEQINAALGYVREYSKEVHLSPTTFLAVHNASVSHVERADTSTVGKTDEADFSTGVQAELSDLDVVDSDPIEGADVHILVHENLLPMVDDTDQLIVKLTNGFADLPDSVIDVMANLGLHLAEPMSSRQVAEVLGKNGLGMDRMGYKTVQKRYSAALALFREYLEEDQRREAL